MQSSQPRVTPRVAATSSLSPGDRLPGFVASSESFLKPLSTPGIAWDSVAIRCCRACKSLVMFSLMMVSFLYSRLVPTDLAAIGAASLLRTMIARSGSRRPMVGDAIPLEDRRDRAVFFHPRHDCIHLVQAAVVRLPQANTDVEIEPKVGDRCPGCR